MGSKHKGAVVALATALAVDRARFGRRRVGRHERCRHRHERGAEGPELRSGDRAGEDRVRVPPAVRRAVQDGREQRRVDHAWGYRGHDQGRRVYGHSRRPDPGGRGRTRPGPARSQPLDRPSRHHRERHARHHCGGRPSARDLGPHDRVRVHGEDGRGRDRAARRRGSRRPRRSRSRCSTSLRPKCSAARSRPAR